MLKAFDFCLPTKSTTVPASPDCFHEVTYDGYRLRLERDGDRVRLITRGGHNWTHRYPWIVQAARTVRQKRFVLDGEGVVPGVDGVSDFNALHSGKCHEEVQFCAFDILVEGADDLRKLPLHLRKLNLERLLARRPDGIFVNPFERGEIGPTYSGPPAGWGLKASSRSIESEGTKEVGETTRPQLRIIARSAEVPPGPFCSRAIRMLCNMQRETPWQTRLSFIRIACLNHN